MTAKLIGRWDADDPAWQQARANRIGGSDIGVICGWSPFVTREQLLLQKAGIEARPEMNAAMSRGRYCEPAVLAWLADRTGATWDPAKDGTWVDVDRDWMLYNPDAISTDGRLAEVKTTSNRAAEHGWGRAGTDQVPITYAAQVQWGLGLLGLTECEFGVLSGRPRFDFAHYRIRFDRDVYAHLVAQAEAFRADLAALTDLGDAA